MKFSQKELRTFSNDISAFFRFAAEQGLQAVQIHLPNAERLREIKRAMEETGVGVASVNAMSCAMLGPDKAAQAHEHQQVKKALAIATELGAPTITNFAGFDYTKTLEENADEFARVYAGHAHEATQRGIKIGFENCPMFGGMPRRAQNMAYCPKNWRLLFEACDSAALGIEFDTAHTVYLGLDTAQLIRDWADRIVHIQIKDAKLIPEQLQEQGCIGGLPHEMCPLGEGDIQVDAVFSAIAEIGYTGFLTSDIEGDNVAGAVRNIEAIKLAVGQCSSHY